MFDDSFDGNPTGLVAGALRHGAHTVVASLSPVPDEHGYVFGVLVTLLMSKRGLSLAAATGVAKRVMASTPRESDGADALIRLFCAARAERQQWITEMESDALREQLEYHLLDKGDPDMAWLSAAAIAKLLDEPPRTLAALTDFLVNNSPLPDQARDPAAAGVITYGITVFGDPQAE